ncbi:hypothetical protein H1P_3660009 [Hyella patelloides LEGE 07179]|uniref:Uncharacterized protein n=1 Tax=Hyella patelloides LEGE 07179 TaxID=945734 RepID=A0A563VWF5_9CYAN|nr:hypothetical protein H1P_3660009 [Hyella patelloides LEGE 07179]
MLNKTLSLNTKNNQVKKYVATKDTVNLITRCQ